MNIRKKINILLNREKRMQQARNTPVNPVVDTGIDRMKGVFETMKFNAERRREEEKHLQQVIKEREKEERALRMQEELRLKILEEEASRTPPEAYFHSHKQVEVPVLDPETPPQKEKEVPTPLSYVDEIISRDFNRFCNRFWTRSDDESEEEDYGFRQPGVRILYGKGNY